MTEYVKEHVIKYSVTDAAIQELKAKYEIIPDASTKEGYKDITTGIAELRENWVGVEKHRKFLKADALEYGRKVDAEAKRITAELSAIAEPLKEAKQKEDERKAKIKAEKEAAEKLRIETIEKKAEAIREIYRESMGKPSAVVAKNLQNLESYEITVEDFHEMTERAETLKEKIVEMMKGLLESTIQQEEVAKEQAKREEELKRLEKEAEERRIEQEKIDREKRAEQERIQKAERERIAKEQAEQEKKIQAERAEMEAERAKIEAERAEIERAKQAEQRKAEEAEREAARAEFEAKKIEQQQKEDAKHKATIKKAKAETLAQIKVIVGDSTTSKTLLDAIERGDISHIQFNIVNV